MMRCRRSRVKKKRYRKRGSGFATNCSFITNCWRPRKQIGKGDGEYIYQLWSL